MFFLAVNKRPFLSLIYNVNFHTRLFHISYSNYIRRVASKYPASDSKIDYLEKRLEQSHIDQNCNVNFLGIESDEGVIIIDSRNTSNDPQLLKQLDTFGKSKENFYKASFGVIRQDSDNKLSVHGQYENIDSLFPYKSTDNSNVSGERHKHKIDIFSKLYNNSNDNYKLKLSIEEPSPSNEVLSGNSHLDTMVTNNKIQQQDSDHKEFSKDHEDVNYIEELYFGNATGKHSSNEFNVMNKGQQDSVRKECSAENRDINYIDELYFGNATGKHNSNEIRVINKGQQDSVRKECSAENRDINYIDELYFGNAPGKHNSNEISVMNKSSNEELSYLNVNDASMKDYLSSNEVNSFQHIGNDKVLSNEAISKDLCDNIENEDLYGAKYLTENESSLDCLKSNSPYFRKSVQTESKDIEKREIKERTLVYSKHLKINKFQKSKTEDFVPEYLSNKDLSHIDFQEDNTILNRKDAQVIKMYPQSNVKPPKTNPGSEYNKGVILPKADELSALEKIDSYKSVVSGKSSDTKEINTAHEFVTKLRNEHEVENQAVKTGGQATREEKLDSKGFRILKNQVPNLSQMTRDEILTMLKDSVLYSDDDLLILNKPYSLVLHDSETTQSPCLSMFLDDLAKDLDRKTTDPKLYTVHRLDKETTGCLLLARNEHMSHMLKSLFAQRKIIKKYWIVTSRLPDPLAGVIDIPISEGSVGNRKRMVLHPQIPKDIPYRNHSRNGKRAVTSYKALSVSGNAALVEVTPETGIKHQIRVHFGFGLSCPILGDHKYSHLDKMAPQKLSTDLLQKLHVRQSKVRHIPMHLHAHSITIPEYVDGRNLYVAAPLPDHMRANLKKLKFKKKNKLQL